MKKIRLEEATTTEEVDAWQEAQDNSNDIYKVSARVKNLARSSGGALTPAGNMLCNLYTHVLLDLYTFAETIKDEKIKNDLINRIRSHEGLPGNLVNAANPGVKK